MKRERHGVERFVIYCLADPRTGEPRYIGKTVNGIKARFRTHVTSAPREHSPKASWIVSLLKLGLEPIFVALETCETAEPLYDLEQRWIAWGRARGFRLTNLNDGGPGNQGANYTEEMRRRMSATMTGRKRPVTSAAWRRNLSMALRGVPKSQEHKANLSKAFLGRKLSPEHKAKVLVGLRKAVATKSARGLTKEQRARISIAIRDSEKCKAVRRKLAAAKVGVPRTAESRRKQSDTLRRKREAVCLS